MKLYRVQPTLDLAMISQMDVRCFRNEIRYIDPGAQWWVIRDGRGRPAGYAGLLHYERNTVFLCRSGILPEYRGRDLQQRLIRVRLRYGRKHGARLAITYTAYNNVASSNNLIASGFHMYDPSFAWAGRDGVIYWQKKLTER
jgi:GNAT superfamily N-acetyltransferase